MMHAFLFTGATGDKREQKIQKQLVEWNISSVDTVSVDPQGEHILIDDIRAFAKQLLLAPVSSPFHTGVVRSAQSMTIEAQNALLKILEEPPPRVRMLIETSSADMLLPTVVSRCEVVQVIGDTQKGNIPLMDIIDMPVGRRLETIEQYAPDRIQAKAFVEEALVSGERMLHAKGDTVQIAALLRKLQLAQAQLALNCNPKLVLDRVFLQFSMHVHMK